MTTETFVDEPLLDASADLSTVLNAWHQATVRLEQTHEALHEEVCRLTHELEIKNHELARKNRLADLGQMAAHVAHEVRNNLMPLKLYLSMLRRRLQTDTAGLSTLEQMSASLVSLEAIVSDLLHFTADRDAQRQEVYLRDLVSDVCQGLRPQLDAQQVQVQLEVPSDAHASLDQSMVRRAVLNLVLNALDVMPSGGQLAITTFVKPGMVELEVADSGPGLSEEVLKHAFEPFFSTKSSGTGLGLAIVYRIAHAHGGTVVAANCSEGGAAFTLHLPC